MSADTGSPDDPTRQSATPRSRSVPGPTGRLSFHDMTLDALPDMQRLLGDPRVMWVYPSALDEEGVRGWIERNLERYREHAFGLWVVRDRATGAFIGECGLVPQEVEGTQQIEVGYHVLPELWGRGYASEAAGACLDYAEKVLGLPRLVALIDPRNVASQHVAENIGLAYERDVQFPTKVLRVYAAALPLGVTGG